MSDSDKKYDLIGTVSGFNVIGTDPNTLPDSRVEHNYTLDDLFRELIKLKNILNVDQLTNLESLITKHMDDFNNPHKVNMDNLNTSVVAELFKEWTKLGNTGDVDDFLKVLFQYVLIADIPETIEGKALDKLTSVRGVATLLDMHNTDDFAHEEVFKRLTPGGKFFPYPSFSFHGFVGIPSSMKATRASKMYVVGVDGYIKELKNNEIASDYTLGEAALPVFGAYTNLVTQSENFSSSFNLVGSSLVLVDVPNLRTLTNSYMIRENSSLSEHSVTSKTGISVTANKVYNLSVYVKPEDRPCFGIRLGGNPLDGDYQFVQFDLLNKQVFVNETMDETRLIGEVHALPNGWYRCCVTFTPIRNATLTYTLYPIDIYDGDSLYQGNGSSGACIFGLQLTQSNIMVPYIPTEGATASLAKTTITVESEEWFSHTNGTIVLRCKNNSKLTDSKNHYMYAIGNASTSACIELRYPNDTNRRAYFTAFKSNNSSLLSKWTTPSDRPDATYIHSYEKSKHLFGYYDKPEAESNETNTSEYINGNDKYLYVGSDRFGGNQLDGYIYSFVYYPATCNQDTIPFFLGEENGNY